MSSWTTNCVGWFVGLSMDAALWDATVYSKYRDRLIEGEIPTRCLQAVLHGERVRSLLSYNHFSVDGSLIEAWASMKSFRPGDDSGSDDVLLGGGGGRNTERDFYGERRSNDTHASATDPDAGLYRTADGQSSRLCFRAHVLMENRNALIVEAVLTHVTGTAERDAAAKNARHLQDLSRWLQLWASRQMV